MQKKKRYIFFIEIGIFIGIFLLLLGISKLVTGNASHDEKIVANVTNTPVVTETPGPTQEVKPTEIDYEAIPGLTEGKQYAKKLIEENSKNVLFLGEDKVGGLYDTMGIISIDKKNETVKIIMIPRDMYVPYNLKVKHYLDLAGKSSNLGFYKINAAHNIGPIMKYKGKFGPSSISFLADIIKEMFGIEVDDYAKVNTEGFVEFINLFGGVDINVPYDMNFDDPFQDLHIHLKKGFQHLDGKQAEGFVRFRQGYDEKNVLHSFGDTERKKNQNAFIKAFIDQHATVENITKIPGVIKTLNKNLKTSVGVGDVVLSYTGLLKGVVVDKYPVESMTITGKGKMIEGVYFMDVIESN